MLVLDTSVLVYATGADHPLREPAVRLLRDVVAARVSATTTPEVLQEYAHVRSRRRDRADAFAQAERFAELLGPLTVVNTRDVLEGLRIWSQTSTLGAFDSVVAAAAIAHGWEAVSTDRSFGSVTGLRWIDLASY
ncbi:MAG: type II toxin-antitoxin system VapC family toxin [Actinobacteria bacterium]|nr:type II toxin-antitoxin system VapC family toxin [Actinomycetota bacterium]